MRCRFPAPLRRRGFTLVEMVVVMAMIAVLLGLATPTFITMRRNAELVSTSNEFLAALSAARAEAMKRQLRAFVVPADGTNWTSGWIAFVDINSNAAGTPAMEPGVDFEIVRHEALASSLSTPTSTGVTNFLSGGVPYAMFNGSGFMTLLGGAFPAGGVHAIDLYNSTDTRRIIANTTGRMRVCKPDAATCSAAASGI
jgi:type IV fimbrial biogenesis protein FimT